MLATQPYACDSTGDSVEWEVSGTVVCWSADGGEDGLEAGATAVEPCCRVGWEGLWVSHASGWDAILLSSAKYRGALGMMLRGAAAKVGTEAAAGVEMEAAAGVEAEPAAAAATGVEIEAATGVETWAATAFETEAEARAGAEAVSVAGCRCIGSPDCCAAQEVVASAWESG